MPRTRTESELREHIKANVKINKNGCWIWQLGKNDYGYGTLNMWDEETFAHRVSYRVFKSNPKGYFVLHKCDTPACVNPAHLFLGTQADNVSDMHKKERARKASGESSGTSVLTARQVIEIKRLYSLPKSSPSAIAKKFGVSKSTIDAIVQARTWKAVDSKRISKPHVGSNHHTAILTEKDVIQIRKEWQPGYGKTKAIADKYGVHSSTITDIIKGRTWKHI